MKNKNNKERIENAQPTLKEKVLLSLGLGMIALGTLGWGSSIVLAFAKVLSVPQLFGSLLGSCALTAVGMNVGALGTNVSQDDKQKACDDSMKISSKQFKEFSNESDYNEQNYGK